MRTASSRRHLALAAVAAAFLPLASCAPAWGAFAGANGAISFSSLPGATGDIFSLDPSSPGSWTQLTSDPADDAQSAFSPDGTRIAFRSRRDGNYEVYVMNADGSGETRLTFTGAPLFSTQPSWSPDGRRLLFRSNRDGDADVWIMEADGSNPVQLSNHPADERYPALSPDGSRIVFISDREGDWEIYVMDSDGTDEVKLTSNAVLDSSPAWAPDGSSIAFRSERDGQSEIYVMKPDGTSQQRLTSNASHDEGPAWSPDGTKIVFRSDRNGDGELYLMDPDGTDEVRLTNAPGSREQSPDWQPVPSSSPQPPHDHPRLASPLRVALVPSFRETLSESQCQARGGAAGAHGAPLSFSSCNPPESVPGTVASLGPGADSFAEYAVVYGDTNPANGDQANLTIRASLGDIRSSNGSDYAPSPSGPDLTLLARLRLTDRLNGGSQSDSATVADFDSATPIDCATTLGPEGSACNVDTSAEATTPGMIRENQAAVVQLFRPRVQDSGANAVRGDSDDRVFATQGIYVP